MKPVSMLFGSKYIFQSSTWYTEPYRDQKIYKDQILSFVNLVDYTITTMTDKVLIASCEMAILNGKPYLCCKVKTERGLPRKAFKRARFYSKQHKLGSRCVWARLYLPPLPPLLEFFHLMCLSYTFFKEEGSHFSFLWYTNNWKWDRVKWK